MDAITVLVVENDEEFRAFLVKTLQDAGFRAVTATSGKAAIELVLTTKPQVLIVDFQLPDTTGDQICRTIKTDPLLKEIIVIVLSASTHVEIKLSCFASGANEYLVKPVEGRELIARMKAFCE